MQEQVSVDVAIFGGGVAGLWALTRLRQAGYHAILLETEALGAGQTLKSQGIIHGGMKYALTGKLTTEATAMAAMPALWRDCLAGTGEIDLSQVSLLSDKHYLWSPSGLIGKIAGFFAGMAMKSKVAAVKKQDYPYVFDNAQFKGSIYALDEIVLDVPSLIAALAKLNEGAIFKVNAFDASAFQFTNFGQLMAVDLKTQDKSIQLLASHFIFAAGAGNGVMVDALKHDNLAMQRRPLHMVMVKTPFYYPLFAHCMGVGPRPRLTVTTHRLPNGEAVWYLGGLLAEEGVDRDVSAQIQAAKHELEALFPWLDFKAAKYATLRVDRAEPHQASGLKPDSVFAETWQNVTVAWPTKLALAPVLAETLLNTVKARQVVPGIQDVLALKHWPAPTLAKPLWETCLWKNAD